MSTPFDAIEDGFEKFSSVSCNEEATGLFFKGNNIHVYTKTNPLQVHLSLGMIFLFPRRKHFERLSFSVQCTAC